MPRTIVKMGRRPNPPPPPGEKTPLGKRAKGYLQTAQSIKEYVTSHPGARSKEMINALGFSLSRIKLVLSKMCEEGLLTKVRDKNVLTTTFLYYTTGADVPPQQKTKREAVRDFVAANPGVLREAIYDHFGKRNCASELCGLVKLDIVRGELLSSGTHYYLINASDKPCAR